MAPNENIISRTINNGVSSAGGYAGGVVDAAGKSVSNAGRNAGDSVTKSTGGAGGSVSNYANSIRDATGASGPRSQTAQNPLGTSGNKHSGKQGVTGAGSKQGASNPLGL
ncbi:hypothetical protein MMC21_007412 [Puttea exsequens]|nr:hypothetical protein [Puttea exsequens]